MKKILFAALALMSCSTMIGQGTSDPVIMRYTSTKHAIVKLISDESLYTFGSFGNSSIYPNAQLFWNDSGVDVH